MTEHTYRYFVRIVSWSENVKWVTADSEEEAQLLAEADFTTNGSRHFKVRSQGIDYSDIEDQHQFGGTA